MAKLVYPYELIGQEIIVIDSKNRSNLNLEGKIVDETKYTLKIMHHHKIKTLMKKNIIIRLKKNNRILEGKTLARRSEERIKGR